MSRKSKCCCNSGKSHVESSDKYIEDKPHRCAKKESCYNNHLVKTPPLGWNTWNTYNDFINESIVKANADALVSSGMRDAGYQYVIIDDGWYLPDRDADGNIQADPIKFPSGMKALGDYIHSLGLKFGIYGAPHFYACSQSTFQLLLSFGLTPEEAIATGVALPGAVGSLNHEQQDADTYASWGVDFLKFDWCSFDASVDYHINLFTRMRTALKNTGRDIVYSINPVSYILTNGPAVLPKTNWTGIANMWRIAQDLGPQWLLGNGYNGVETNIEIDAPLYSQAGASHWNDPDMLVIGVDNPSYFGPTVLTPEEGRSNFSMWAMLAAPLIASNDLTTMDEETRKTLTNKNVIAVDQDKLGIQGKKIISHGVLPNTTEVWTKPLCNGDIAVALLNSTTESAEISVTREELGINEKQACVVKNLWTNKKFPLGPILSERVPSHGVAMFRIRCKCSRKAKPFKPVCQPYVSKNQFQLATTYDNAVKCIPIFTYFESPVSVTLTPPSSYSQNTTQGIFRLHINNISLPISLQNNNLNLYYTADLYFYYGVESLYPIPCVTAGASVNNLSPPDNVAFYGGGSDAYGPYWDFGINFFAYCGYKDWWFCIDFINATTFERESLNIGIVAPIAQVLQTENTGDVFLTVSAQVPQYFMNVTRSNRISINPVLDLNVPEYTIFPAEDLNTLHWKSGDTIVYNNNGSSDIPGLVNGFTYYLIRPTPPPEDIIKELSTVPSICHKCENTRPRHTKR